MGSSQIIKILNTKGANNTTPLRSKLYKYKSENSLKIGTKMKKLHKIPINPTNKVIKEDINENIKDLKTKRGMTAVPLDQFGRITRIVRFYGNTF